MRWLFAWFGGLLVIALFTALIAPYFIDWTAYKSTFEREASRITGHDVEVLGKMEVRLLPLPSVTFNRLVAGKNRDGTPIMTADRFVMNIELAPLLKGEIRIVNPTLIRPGIELYLDENGMAIWPEHREFTIDPERISLENLAIVNAEIRVHEQGSGQAFFLEQMDADLDARSLYGPWFIEADGYVQGKQTYIRIATGHLRNDGAMHVNLTAQYSDFPYSLSLGGVMQLKKGRLHWDGEYELSTQNGSRNDIPDNKNGEKRIFSVLSHGKFGATTRMIEIPEFNLEIGESRNPYKITGTGSIKIDKSPNFQIQAHGRPVNLDEKGVMPDRGGGNDTTENSRIGFEQGFGALRRFLEKVPVPSARGSLALSLPAIVAGDSVIRKIDMIISSDEGGWQVRRLSGVLPGDTKFETRGTVSLYPQFSFKGSILLASSHPSVFAAWAGIRSVSINKLHSAGFMADIVLLENELNLNNLQVVLDKTVMGGNLRLLVVENRPPTIVAQLDGEEMDIDHLQALFAFVTRQDASRTSGLELNIGLHAGKLSGPGISAEKADIQFRLSGDSISIEKLEASDFLGVSFASFGHIENFPEKPDGSFELKVKSQDASRLAQFIQSQLLSDKLPGSFFQSGLLDEDIDLVFAINARSSGTLEEDSKGQVIVRGEAGGSKIDIMVNFEGNTNVPGALSFDISSTLENENPAKLLMQLAIPALPVNIAIAGPLTIFGSFIGSSENGFESLVTAQTPEADFLASGKIYPVGDNAGAMLNVKFGVRDIAPLALLAGIGSPLQIFSDKITPVSFSGDFELKKNRISLDSGEGQVGGEKFFLGLDFKRQDSSNSHINGELVTDSLSFPLLVRMVPVNGASDTDSGRNQESFGQPWLQGLDGEIGLSVKRSDFGVGKYAENIKGKMTLADGSINFNNIRGEWLGGNFVASLSLMNDGEKASLNTRYAFRNINAQSVTETFGMPDFISANMNVEGELQGSGRSSAAIVSSLTGSGIVDLKNIRVFHFNDSPLQSIFAAVDKEGFKITDSSVLSVLDKVIDRGEISIERISFPYIVKAGELLARNVFSMTEKVEMAGDARIDISDQTVNSGLSVRFDPGKRWVDGALPQIKMTWNGSLKMPVRNINVQELSGFLLLEKFEQQQRKADLLQASILEKGRLQRDVIFSRAQTSYLQRLRKKVSNRKREELLIRKENRLYGTKSVHHERLSVKESMAESK